MGATAGTLSAPEAGAAGSSVAGSGASSSTAGSMTAQGGTNTGGLAGNTSGGDAAGSGGSGGVAEPPLGSWPPPALKLTPIADADQPTAIIAAPGDPTRLFFIEKEGRVRVIKDGALLPTPALDISANVLEGDPPPSAGDKRGLMALAFHPDYQQNGRLFVWYSRDQNAPGHTQGDLNDGDIYLEEYRRGANADTFDPTPKGTLITIDKGNCGPCYQHNGASLEVGPDGFLYASMGDPPPYNDPGSQDLASPLGKLLRWDISQSPPTPAGNYPGAAPEVWHIGLRNPYKFSFDSITGDLYIGDVGEETWEEVSVTLAGDQHKNFGWPMREATHGTACAECVEPVTEYGHDNADNAVIGGIVYRGKAIPELQGTYLYGDNGSGRVRALQAKAGKLVQEPMILPDLHVMSACFGQDNAGELYVCGYTEGKIFRVDAL
jgi:glucose/arabinose dehydrogenase